MLIAFHGFTVILFVLLGVLFSCGKGAGLIAGYNTASQEKKAKYDEKKLCKFMGKLMFALAACWMVILLSEFWGFTLLWIGLGLFIAVIAGGLVYMNTGNRMKRQ